MKTFSRILFAVFAMTCFLLSQRLYAQCSAHSLAALDEEHQTFDATVWTNNVHCPAGGQMMMRSDPPGAALFEGGPYQVESFFDVFTEFHTAKPAVMPGMYPIMVPFDLVVGITFDDPAYIAEEIREQVVITPMMTLQEYRISPCSDNVPFSMAPGQSSCFVVCHRVYHVDLGSALTPGRPVLSVSPGCFMLDPCPDLLCNPGAPTDYRWEVYELGGRWVLEFEYSNRWNEPACYCVTYQTNLPPNCVTHALGALDEKMQTFAVTLWGSPTCTQGFQLEAFTYPAGGYVGTPMEQICNVGDEERTFAVPVGRGVYTPGLTFKLISYLNDDCICPGEPCPQVGENWIVETVQVLPNGGLALVDGGGECQSGGGVIVPSVLNLGQPECIRVCHDVYRIPLAFPGPGIPNVTVYEGCGISNPCPLMPGCSPGLPYEYRYDVYRIGGSWILEFEHSNPMHEPVCYCLHLDSVTPVEVEGYGLVALDGVHQTFNVSVWGSSPTVPLRGSITLSSNPPGVDFDWPVESFFDVFTECQTFPIPVEPGPFTTGQNVQLIAEFDGFGPGSDPFEGQVCSENVIVTPSGDLARWDPVEPCTEDHVPPSMGVGDSTCFIVCHGIYETILYYPPGASQPVIEVTPGCMPPHCFPPIPCVPGGPADYCYQVYHDGVNWILRFEYSNPIIQPVCYCVKYAGNVPANCFTHELVALDERHLTLDVSLWVTGDNPILPCPADGQVTIASYPAGALIDEPVYSFFDVFTEVYTRAIPVEPGSFQEGESFQFIVYVNYSDPAYPDVWKTEEVMVAPGDPPYLVINDAGGQCSPGSEQVPGWMNPGESFCFHVCHRVYRIPLGWYLLNPPSLTVTPGCFGPPQDHCLAEPCVPGGPFDFRYDLVLMNQGEWMWELEFEYSNDDIEPVCYCVSIEPAPCDPVADLVVFFEPPTMLEPLLHFYWTSPQAGLYRIYSSIIPNATTEPPSPEWLEEALVTTVGGWTELVQPFDLTMTYKKYVVVHDCDGR